MHVGIFLPPRVTLLCKLPFKSFLFYSVTWWGGSRPRALVLGRLILELERLMLMLESWY